MPEPLDAIVSDTGPFITLEKLPDGFKLLRQLYDRVFIPASVLTELSAGLPAGTHYLEHYGLADLVEVVAVTGGVEGLATLDPAERDALTLALEKGLPLLIEETRGRDAALEKGLHYSGIAGQVLRARKLGILSREETLEKLQALYRAHRINRKLLVRLTQSLPAEAPEA